MRVFLGLLIACASAACVQTAADPVHPAPGEPDAAVVVHVVDAGVADRAQAPDAAPTTGSVGYTGGSVNHLVFAVFGDVRPMDMDMAGEYPTAIIDSIMAQIGDSYAEFALGTGDYMYATSKSEADTQLANLTHAELSLGSRPIFHAVGNHECSIDTTSNCPNGTETANMVAFMTTLLSFETHPYYSFNVTTDLGEAKFVVIAANAWSTAQGTWLESVLSKPTKYTFVVRHEPSSDTRAPGVTPSDTILANHPGITLLLYGHTHTYERVGANGVISGNAGAPVTGYYGWLSIEQLPDGNIAVSSIDQANNSVIDRWVVDPTGVDVH